jgi:thermitase
MLAAKLALKSSAPTKSRGNRMLGASAIDPAVVQGKWRGRNASFAANRVVVGFSPIPGDQADYAIAAESVVTQITGLRLKRKPSRTGRAVFIIESGADATEIAKRIAKLPGVDYAEPDFVHTIDLLPNDPLLQQQWGLMKINAPLAWDRTTGVGTGLLIGVVDSGISIDLSGGLNHPDFDDAIRYTLGTDFVDGGTPRDEHGHGTHVAGIAAAETNNAVGIAGVNWTTPVYITRVFDANGSGFGSDVADAIEETVDYARYRSLRVVINYSGSSGSPSTTARNACRYVYDNGMLLCAATGNNSGPVRYPAAYSTDFVSVIAVGSTDSTDAVSVFSNFGPEVTVVAPGNGVLSTLPTYPVTIPATNFGSLSGTSMATPHVAGLCSLLWSAYPQWIHADVRNRIVDTATKLASSHSDPHWGYGRINAGAALTMPISRPLRSLTPLLSAVYAH